MVNVIEPNSSAGLDNLQEQVHRRRRRPKPNGAAGSERKSGVAVGSSDAVFQSTRREETPPKNQLDADDRRDSRATRSETSLDLQIRLENHRNRLEWQRMLRLLVFYGGIVALSGAFAFLLTFAGFSSDEAARIVLAGLVSGISGYGLRGFITKIWDWNSSRKEQDQDKSSS